MTLLERIEYFERAARSRENQPDTATLINEMSAYDLLSEISEAMEHAGFTFNTKW